MSGSRNWPEIGRITKRVSILLVVSVLFSSHISALSPEQKRIFQKNIRYFNIDDCSAAGASETPANDTTVNGDTQELAQQMLKNNHITYWANAPESAAPDWSSRVPAGGNTSSIDTKDVVRALAQGDPAYTTAANAPSKTADLNPNILKFILEAAGKGNIMVNALTDKTHSSSASNHYKGLAVDLDLNTSVSISDLNKIADKYGGVKNSESDHHHYDFLKRPKETASASQRQSNSPSNIYMVGDSVTVGAYYVTGDLKRDVAAENWSIEVDASGGRGMEYPGSENRGNLPGRTKSGLEAIKADSDAIKKADTVVVALGTNESNTDLNASKSADIFKGQMKEAISSIKKINPDAVIDWVNISSKPTSITPYVKEYNIVIDTVAAAEGVNVIDTAKAGIPLNPDGIHPDYGEGWKKWSKAVVDGIKEGGSGGTADSTTTTQCQCNSAAPSGSTALVGSDNPEKIFNFFVAQGLEPYQAAAIMGNMNAESGFDPTIIEGGSHGDTPTDGVGFGLVQWTYSDRQDPLVELARKKGVKPSDLGVQLEYVMVELEGKYKDIFNELKASSNVEEATLIIETKYEVHAGSVQPQRTADAKSYLAKYGSGVGDAGSVSGSSACTTNDESGAVVGEYSLPVDKSIYTAHPDWFSGPHHDYPAVDIPVPSGTKIYSMTAGKVIVAPVGGTCGSGVLIDAGNGVEYVYCHGSDGGSIAGAKTGDTVKPGQLIMHSDNTGSSTGPHLHVQIKVNGTLHCPQNLFKSIVQGSPEKEQDLPTSGCVS